MKQIKLDKIFWGLIILGILIRILLLFMNPITMWTDPVARYIPNTFDVLRGDFSFYTPPLMMMINSFPTIFLDGAILEFFWKLTPFIFFLLSVFIFIRILKNIELSELGRVFLLCLFLFSVYSILMSTTIMLEMPVLFFTLFLFYIFEKNDKIDLKLFSIIVRTSALLLYTKQTGYFIFAGFILYNLFKKMDKKQKKLILLALILGLLLNVPWMIKNIAIYGNVLSGEEGVSEVKGIGDIINLDANYLLLTSEIFHLAYRIPYLSELNYFGIFFVLSRIYYFSFLIVSLFLTIVNIVGIITYGRKYKRYILIILPIFLFVFWLAFLSKNHFTLDFGRYMFSFYFLFFFFGLKFIENIRSVNIKRFLYLIIILFCILSIATSFAMSYEFHKKDIEIRKVAEFIKNKEGIFISDDHYTRHALIFYTGNKIPPLDEGIKCQGGRKIYSSLKYKIYLNENKYYVCKL